FARPSFPTALKWALVPPELSYIGDRVFRSIFSHARHPIAVAPQPTVGYTNYWSEVYRAAGEEPPADCRDLRPHIAKAAPLWPGLDEERGKEIQEALGIKLAL